MTKELYVSIDTETDGSHPGKFSMVAIGASVSGSRELKGDKQITRIARDEDNVFYAELKPISEEYNPEALAVGSFNGLEYDATPVERRTYLEAFGEDPGVVMNRFVDWGLSLLKKYDAKTLVFTAYPLGFDWLFTYWYLCQFTERSGVMFSHSRHVDIKSYFAGKWDTLVTGATKRNFPKSLMPSSPHTHNALDDAVEQGEMFMNMLLASPPEISRYE